MEKIRSKRKRLSVITLIFFISMMLFDNAVFASSVNEVNTSVTFDFTYNITEAGLGDNLEITLNVSGNNDYISYADVSYRSLSNDAFRIPVGFYMNAEEELKGGQYIQSSYVSGDYAVDTVTYYTEQGVFTVFNEAFYPEEAVTAVFSEKEFTVSGTYGGIIPEYNLTISDHEFQSGENIIFEMVVDSSSFAKPFNAVDLQYNNKRYELKMFEDNTFRYEGVIAPYDVPGTHELSSVTFRNDDLTVNVYDDSYPDALLKQDLSIYDYTVTGTQSDSGDPVLKGIEIIDHAVTPEQTTRIILDAEDDFSGIFEAVLNFSEADSSGMYQDAFTVLLKLEDNQLIGYPEISRYINSGRYILTSVMLIDKSGNDAHYNPMSNPELVNPDMHYLDVYGTTSKYQPIESLTVSSTEASPSQSVEFQLTVDETYMKYDSASLIYTHGDNGIQRITLEKSGENEYIGSYTPGRSTEAGLYEVSYIALNKNHEGEPVEHIVHNSKVYPAESNLMDLTSGSFTVTGTMGGVVPEIDLSTDKAVYGAGDVISVELDMLTEVFNPEMISIHLRHTEYEYETFYENLTFDPATSTYVGKIENIKYAKAGSYDVLSISMEIEDEYFHFWNSKYWDSINAMDFEDPLFTLSGTLAGMPLEYSVETAQDIYSHEDRAEFSFSFGNEFIRPLSVDLSFINVEDENAGFDIQMHYDQDTDMYFGSKMWLTQYRPGSYELVRVSYVDQWEYRTYYKENTMDTDAIFQTEGPLFSITNPFWNYQPDITIDSSMEDATIGDVITVTVQTPTDLTDYDGGTIYYLVDGGFSVQKNLSKVSPGVYEFEHLIEAYTRPGEYRVENIYLHGQDHSIDIYHLNSGMQYETDLSGGQYTVTGTTADDNPPRLVDIIIPENAFTESSITIEVEAEDDLAGVSSGFLKIFNKNNHFMKHVYLEVVDGKLIGELSLYNGDEGIWQIQNLELSDLAGNSIFYYNENSDYLPYDENPMNLGNLEIDVKKRVLSGVEIVQNEFIYGPNEKVNLNLSIMEAEEYSYLQLTYLDPLEGYIILEGYQNSEGSFDVEYLVKPYYASGAYELISIRGSSNGTSAEIQDGDASEYGYGDLSAGDFILEGTKPDVEAPVFESLFFSKASLVTNEELSVTLKARDESSGLSYGSLTMQHEETKDTMTISLNAVDDGVMKGYEYIQYWLKSGKYSMIELSLTDVAGNTSVYVDESMEGNENTIPFDFSLYSFTVTGNTIDTEAPEFLSLTMDKDSVPLNGRINYTLNYRDNIASYMNVMIEYSNNQSGSFNVYHSFEGSPSEEIFTKRVSDLYGITSGVYKVDTIHLSDNAGNRTIIKRPGAEVHYEGNIIEMDLSSLDIEFTEAVVLNQSEYFSSITFDREIIKANEIVNVTLVPGEKFLNAERITLFYDSYNRYVLLTKNTEGDFTGEFKLSEAYAGSVMELRKIRAVFQGRHLDIGDTRFLEETLLTDLKAGDYEVAELEQDTKPIFRNISITDGEYTAGDVVPIEIQIDHPGDTVIAYFRVDGKHMHSDYTSYRDGEVYRVGAYVPSGKYTVDSISIFSRTGETYIPNKVYYPSDPDAVVMDAAFTVTGTVEDNSAPEFRSITSDKKTASVGDVITYTLDAVDEESGLDYALLYLEAPNRRDYRAEVILRPNAMGQLQGTFKIESEHVSGLWKPSNVRLVDKKGNTATYGNFMSSAYYWGEMTNMESADVMVTTQERQDIKAPVFNGFSYLNINGNKLIELDATDDISGVNQIMLRYASGDTMSMIHGDVFRFNGKYYAELPEIDGLQGKTMYLVEVRLTDFAGNAVRYVHGTSDDGAYTMNMSFGTLTDEEYELGKLVDSIIIDDNIGTAGDELMVSLTLTEPQPNIHSIFAEFNNNVGHGENVHFMQVSDVSYQAVISINDDFSNGYYTLDRLFIERQGQDIYRVANLTTQYDLNEAEELMDLSDVYFEVHGVQGIEQKPLSVGDIRIVREESGLKSVIQSIGSLFGLDKPAYVPGDLVKIQIEVENSDSDLTEMYLEYTNKYKRWSYGNFELLKVSEDLYETEFSIHDYIYPGDWSIDSIRIINEHGQEFIASSYGSGVDYNKLSGFEKLNFNVENEHADYTSPEVMSVSVGSSTVLKGETIRYIVEAKDDLSGIMSMNILVKGTFTGKEIFVEMSKNADGLFEGNLETEDLAEDVWRVKLIYVEDNAYNYGQYVNSNYNYDPGYSRINMDAADVNLMSVKDLTISKLPEKLNYFTGEKLDLTGLVVAAILNDDSERILTDKEYTVSGFDSSKAVTDQIITVTYGNHSETFSVNVTENELVGIEITTLPEKRTYFVGEELDTAGMVVTGTYKDGSKAVLDVTENNVTGFNSTQATKEQALTVTIQGKTATFTVDIMEKSLIEIILVSPPVKLTYLIGESFDLTGLELLAKYNDGSSVSIPLSEVTVTGFDSSMASSKQTVTLSVDPWSFEVDVEIIGEETDAVEVLAGANRYRTATAISQASYSSADTVILVQANNFPDALAAGPLAYMMDAPILLTGTASLSSSVKEEMSRLKASKVIIMGGYSAVSENVENALKAEGYTVERLEGSNRYATAVTTAQLMETRLGARKTVVLASGNQFADALAAGSYAAKEGHPILLTDGNRLTKTTMDYITEGGVDNIILVGGTSVISEALEAHLKTMGITITRKSGKNRFDTSLEIAKSYFENAEMAIVANGMEFADALAAAPYAAKMDAPIILVNQTRINLPIKEYLPLSPIQKIVVVGGDAAVSEAVRNELEHLIR